MHQSFFGVIRRRNQPNIDANYSKAYILKLSCVFFIRAIVFENIFIDIRYNEGHEI